MGKAILNDNHIIMRSPQSIQQLCLDFFHLSGIKFFVFSRTYQDNDISAKNKGFCLSSHGEWIQHFFTHDYDHRISFLGVDALGHFDGYKILCCNLFEDNIMFKNLRDTFSIDHGVIVCKQYQHCHEWYTFACDKTQSQMIYYYLNHFQTLLQFILYFKFHAKCFISEAENSVLRVPKPTSENKFINNSQATEILFGQQQKINLIDIGNEIIELTKREYQCLMLLKKGYSSKMMAKKLGLSHRTIESHIAQCYVKLKCHSKTELLFKIEDT